MRLIRDRFIEFQDNHHLMSLILNIVSTPSITASLQTITTYCRSFRLLPIHSNRVHWIQHIPISNNYFRFSSMRTDQTSTDWRREYWNKTFFLSATREASCREFLSLFAPIDFRIHIQSESIVLRTILAGCHLVSIRDSRSITKVRFSIESTNEVWCHHPCPWRVFYSM